jgi:hypothetical protein|tara:strand:+ start:2085 stop:2237 length:153 start_codon:yes stop_codon:yes gene_type:complete
VAEIGKRDLSTSVEMRDFLVETLGFFGPDDRLLLSKRMSSAVKRIGQFVC